VINFFTQDIKIGFVWRSASQFYTPACDLRRNIGVKNCLERIAYRKIIGAVVVVIEKN
jgi:hypothetical protein